MTLGFASSPPFDEFAVNSSKYSVRVYEPNEELKICLRSGFDFVVYLSLL
jgi:hypothetical protein